MATVAVRAPKRDLAPDWRDALRDAVRRFAIRTWGALLIMLSVAGAVALGSHNPTDPSLSTAAGGPPANWLGSGGAYFSDALLPAVRPRLGPVHAGGRARGTAHAAPAARRAHWPVAAARRARRSPDRGRVEPHQRIGGIRPPCGLGRSARARRGAWSRFHDWPCPQSIDCRTRAAGRAAAVRARRSGGRLCRAGPQLR